MKKLPLIIATVISGSALVACNSGGGSSGSITPAPTNGFSTTFAGNNNIFSATTDNPSTSKILTLSNSGESTISQITFTLPTNGYFTIESDTGSSTPCDINAQNITNTLTQSQSCTVKVVYTNSTETTSASTNIVFNYLYGESANTYNTPVIYSTSSSSPTPPTPSGNLPVGDCSTFVVYDSSNILPATGNVTFNPALFSGGPTMNLIQAAYSNYGGGSIMFGYTGRGKDSSNSSDWLAEVNIGFATPNSQYCWAGPISTRYTVGGIDYTAIPGLDFSTGDTMYLTNCSGSKSGTLIKINANYSIYPSGQSLGDGSQPIKSGTMNLSCNSTSFN